MKSVQDVYKKLTKHDLEKQLTFFKDKNQLELKLNDYKKVIILDENILYELNNEIFSDETCSCFNNVNYYYIYSTLYQIMKGITPFPKMVIIEKKEWELSIIVLISLLFASFPALLIGGFIGGILFFPILFLTVIAMYNLLRLSKYIMRPKIDKTDYQTLKEYHLKKLNHYLLDSDLYHIFNYLHITVAKVINEAPRKLKLNQPLNFDEEEKTIKKVTKNRQKDEQSKEVYLHYQKSLAVIEILNKYYKMDEGTKDSITIDLTIFNAFFKKCQQLSYKIIKLFIT